MGRRGTYRPWGGSGQPSGRRSGLCLSAVRHRGRRGAGCQSGAGAVGGPEGCRLSRSGPEAVGGAGRDPAPPGGSSAPAWPRPRLRRRRGAVRSRKPRGSEWGGRPGLPAGRGAVRGPPGPRGQSRTFRARAWWPATCPLHLAAWARPVQPARPPPQLLRGLRLRGSGLAVTPARGRPGPQGAVPASHPGPRVACLVALRRRCGVLRLRCPAVWDPRLQGSGYTCLTRANSPCPAVVYVRDTGNGDGPRRAASLCTHSSCA